MMYVPKVPNLIKAVPVAGTMCTIGAWLSRGYSGWEWSCRPYDHSYRLARPSVYGHWTAFLGLESGS